MCRRSRARLPAAGFAVFDLRYRLAPQHRFRPRCGMCCAPWASPSLRLAKALLCRWQAHRAARTLGGGTLALTAAYAAAAQAAVPAVKLDCQHCGRAVPSSMSFRKRWWASIPGPICAPSTISRPIDPLDSRTRCGRIWARQPSFRALCSASPLFYAGLSGLPGGTLPPTLLIHGESDAMVPAAHSERLADALRRAGYTPQTLFIPLAEHGFDFALAGRRAANEALVLRFLGSAL